MSDPKKADSVFDILYADNRRISSLLSQLSEDGIVTEITRAVAESSSSDFGLSAKVIKSGAVETGSRSSSRKMDPQWLMPLLFLDQVKDILNRNIENAQIGSFVLTTGKLVITDLSIVEQMWKSPTMKRQVMKGMSQGEHDSNRQQRRSSRSPVKKDSSEQEAILEMLSFLPHVPQANIVTDDYAVWSTIDPQFLLGTVSDLILKHGAKVTGSWSMIGILDAKPLKNVEDGQEYDEILSVTEMLNLGMFMDSIWKVATELSDPIRQALGRPLFSYGMTPLVILREIG